MRVRRPSRLLAMVLAGALTAGCSAQAPSELQAVDALVQMYDQSSGVWPNTGWWNSANALTAVADYMIASGDRRYVYVIENTYNKKRNAARGNFVNDLLDDTGWWALAWIRAYDLTGDMRYLNTARRGIDFMWAYQDDVCGGGLWWTVAKNYKNAITSQLFVKAAAELSIRMGESGAPYLERAVTVWDWFAGSGMINDELLVNDGLDNRTCLNNGDQTWTYNQGVLLGGLVALAEGTGDQAYLDRARQLADASTESEYLNPDGVLTEPCEAYGCDVDGPTFKGVFVRNLAELNRALDDHPYSDYLLEQATTAYENARTDGNQYGVHWNGPISRISAATQQSAVDLLIAAQPIEDEEESATG